MSKKHLTFALLATALAVGFSSCNKVIEEENEGNSWLVDYLPIEIYMTVQNAEGVNLLDPENLDGIKATFNDEVYAADTTCDCSHFSPTREYPARMHGLICMKLKDGTYALYFGELDGGGYYKEEPLTIEWPNGTTDVICINSEIKPNKKDGYPEVVNRYFKLNGKVVDEGSCSPLIQIYK